MIISVEFLDLLVTVIIAPNQVLLGKCSLTGQVEWLCDLCELVVPIIYRYVHYITLLGIVHV